MKKFLLTLGLLCAMPSAWANISQAQATQTIKDFYQQYVFNGADVSPKARQLFTAPVRQALKEAYEYDCDDGECYAINEFRTGAQDGDGENRLVTIEPFEGDSGWYRVYYYDMGWKGITDIQLIKENGKIKINDYDPIFDETLGELDVWQ